MPSSDDISKELEHVKAELENTKITLDMLENTISGGIAQLDINDGMSIISASRGYYQMTGYTEAESYNPPFNRRGINLVVSEDIPLIHQALENLIQSGKPLEVSYRIRKKDGSIAWNTAYCTTLVQNGSVMAADIFFMDTTSTKHTENQLNSLLNNIPSGVVRASIEPQSSGQDILILYANDYFYEQIGYTAKEFAQGSSENRYLEIVHPLDRMRVYKNALKLVQTACNCPFLEYRIVTSSGDIRWVRSRATQLFDSISGKHIIQAIINDITEEKNQKRRNTMIEEQFRIIAEQTCDTIFKWDFTSDTISFSPVYVKMFGYPLPGDISLQTLRKRNVVYKEDQPVLEKLIQRILDKAPVSEAQFRVRRADKSYIWVRCRITNIFDEDGLLLNAVGILTDIDAFKKETENLKYKATTDSLTGISNRMNSQNQIQLSLTDPGQKDFHAMILFDIDRFKNINDLMGHSAGDTVLQYISWRLKHFFYDGDMIGRMGGDEFIIFIKHLPLPETAQKRAEQLRSEIHRDFTMNNLTLPLSISVGVSIFPTHGHTFETLYEHADHALYQSKRNGGNQVTLYQSQDD